MRSIHHDQTMREELRADLDEIARQGARRMLAEALEAEVQAYTSRLPKKSETREDMPWW